MIATHQQILSKRQSKRIICVYLQLRELWNSQYNSEALNMNVPLTIYQCCITSISMENFPISLFFDVFIMSLQRRHIATVHNYDWQANKRTIIRAAKWLHCCWNNRTPFVSLHFMQFEHLFDKIKLTWFLKSGQHHNWALYFLFCSYGFPVHQNFGFKNFPLNKKLLDKQQKPFWIYSRMVLNCKTIMQLIDFGPIKIWT